MSFCLSVFSHQFLKNLFDTSATLSARRGAQALLLFWTYLSIS